MVKLVLKFDSNGVLVKMTKETFFGLRRVLSDCLGVLPDSKRVEYEVSEDFKRKFELLQEHSELGKLYEEMVVRDQCTTQDEFFMNISQYHQAMKLKKINDQENPRNTDFFIPKRREVESGEEMILMRIEDKLKLLDQFPELRQKFAEKFLDKFNDQPEEEARFWDEFWRLQKENKSLLYGGEAKDSKEVMNSLPIFSDNGSLNLLDNEETVRFEDAVDALNLQERQDELYERFLFPGKSDDRLENLATLINNHSIMIKSKERKSVTQLLKEMKASIVDTDQKNVVCGKMDLEIVDRKKERQKNLTIKAAEVEEKFKSKYDKQKQVELENVWKDFVNERKKRRDRRLH